MSRVSEEHRAIASKLLEGQYDSKSGAYFHYLEIYAKALSDMEARTIKRCAEVVRKTVCLVAEGAYANVEVTDYIVDVCGNIADEIEALNE